MDSASEVEVRREYRINEETKVVDVVKDSDAPAGVDRRVATVEGVTSVVEIISRDPERMVLRIDGRIVVAATARGDDSRTVTVRGGVPVVFHDGGKSARKRAAADADVAFAASMHSQVIDVAVAIGDQVARGDTLIVLEAMKMESRIIAPYDGTVVALHCAKGDVVEQGRSLLELSEQQDP